MVNVTNLNIRGSGKLLTIILRGAYEAKRNITEQGNENPTLLRVVWDCRFAFLVGRSVLPQTKGPSLFTCKIKNLFSKVVQKGPHTRYYLIIISKLHLKSMIYPYQKKLPLEFENPDNQYLSENHKSLGPLHSTLCKGQENHPQKTRIPTCQSLMSLSLLLMLL